MFNSISLYTRVRNSRIRWRLVCRMNMDAAAAMMMNAAPPIAAATTVTLDTPELPCTVSGPDVEVILEDDVVVVDGAVVEVEPEVEGSPDVAEMTVQVTPSPTYPLLQAQ